MVITDNEHQSNERGHMHEKSINEYSNNNYWRNNDKYNVEELADEYL